MEKLKDKLYEYAEDIVNTLREPLILLDKNMHVIFANPSFYRTFQVVPKETEGKFIYDLGKRQWNISKLRELLEAILSDNKSFEDYEVDHNFPIIGRRVMLLNAKKLYRNTDNTELILLAFEDITRRKLVEKELMKIMAELERSNEGLESFARIASHDLQEPLRTITSFIQLLEKDYKGKLDQEANQFINYAVDGATRMQSLIRDLLNYSHISIIEKELEHTDCESAVRMVLMNLKLSIEENSVIITYDSLPTVMAHTTQMVQLFQNLISNAIKFCKNSPLKIHISAEQKEREYLFSIRDNGIGIDPEFADQIFQPFRRLHAKNKYPGSGLGLAVCKKIVEQYGGLIWVESVSGNGSTFCFTIPINSEKL